MLEPSSCTIRINNYDYLLNVSSAYQPGTSSYNRTIIEFTSDGLLPSVPLSSIVLDSSIEISSSNCYTQENKLIFECSLQEYYYKIVKEQITIKVIESTFILNNTIPDYVYVVDDSTSTTPSNKTKFKPSETVWVYIENSSIFNLTTPNLSVARANSVTPEITVVSYPVTGQHYSFEMPMYDCDLISSSDGGGTGGSGNR